MRSIRSLSPLTSDLMLLTAEMICAVCSYIPALVTEDQKTAASLYRENYREERRAAEAARYSEHRGSILARRRERQIEKKVSGAEAESVEDRDDQS